MELAEQCSASTQTFVRKRMLTILCCALALLLVILSTLRVLGIDGNRYTAALLALTPYAALFGLFLGVATLVLRQWWIGGIVLSVTLSLFVLLVPRAFANEQPTMTGRPLRVMAVNLYLSRADPAAVVNLVRENKVEVLSLLELEPGGVQALAEAGLFHLLPHRVLDLTGTATGSGLASVYPLVKQDLTGPSTFSQPSARIELGGGVAAEVVAVHPVPPVTSREGWAQDLAALPLPQVQLPVRILAGDFNATLDHAQLRRLVNAGYVDAAEQRGAGLVPTWPAKLFPPPVTIDHVLVDNRVAVNDYQVFPVPGTDHRAVFAALTVPE